MAIPQQANAVFYHPLDNVTESLKSQAWTGSAAAFAAGKVSNALVETDSGPFSFGAETEFLGASASAISVVGLSESNFVVAYWDGGLTRGKAKVGTVAGTDITFGADAEFFSFGNQVLSTSVAVLSPSTFVLAYHAGGFDTYVKFGTVTGTVIAFGGQDNVVGATDPVVTASGAGFVVAYTTGSIGRAEFGAISGTNIFLQGPAPFTTNSFDNASIAPFGANAFVVTYRRISDDAGQASVGAVAGTFAITFGSSSTFAGSTQSNSIVALDATTLVVAYGDGGGRAKVGTVSALDITFGAEATFSANAVGDIAVVTLGANAFAVAYQDSNNSNHGTVNFGAVSGTDITFGAESEFLGADGASDIAAAALSATTFAVAYRDGDDSNHGTAKIGVLLPPGASLTASTPAAYDSTVAATRLVFAAWSKSPSVT